MKRVKTRPRRSPLRLPRAAKYELGLDPLTLARFVALTNSLGIPDDDAEANMLALDYILNTYPSKILSTRKR